MCVIENIVKEMNYKNIKQQLNKELFSNLYGIMQVTVTLLVNSASCKRFFFCYKKD